MNSENFHVDTPNAHLGEFIFNPCNIACSNSNKWFLKSFYLIITSFNYLNVIANEVIEDSIHSPQMYDSNIIESKRNYNPLIKKKKLKRKIGQGGRGAFILMKKVVRKILKYSKGIVMHILGRRGNVALDYLERYVHIKNSTKNPFECYVSTNIIK